MDSPNLTRLGNLLVDLKAVSAVAPLWLDDNHTEIHGYHVVTTGGVLKVEDAETVEALRQQFYEPQTSHM